MKKIVFFSDGTGNSSSSPHKTNVWRTYQALDTSAASKQIAFYDNGVGTSSFTPTAIIGLAFGWGLARNVRQIYGFLCRTYDCTDGAYDQIYGFGFSRGAFTIRVAMALIASEGIIDRNKVDDDRDLERLISAAYHRYRKENFTPSFLSFFLRPVRDFILDAWHRARGRKLYDPEKNIRYKDGPDDPPLIKFVGVWDTVDAYGLSVDELTLAWDKVVWPLTAKDRDLSHRIERACHALALDEQRESFEPMLWNEKGKEDERIRQVWFAGVHSDIGGGYPDDALSYGALNWMLDESAKDSGLIYIAGERQRYIDRADVRGPMHDSRRGVGNVYRYAPRHIDRLCREKRPGLANWLKAKLRRPGANDNEVHIVRPKIHHTVFDHLKQSGDAYAPINIPKDYALVDSSGAVIGIQVDGPISPLESPQQAEDRRRRQTFVWNKVWARKLVYFLTLAAVFFFVAYPYIAEPGDGGSLGWIARLLEPLLGTFGFVVRAIPEAIGKIPGLGFIGGWASAYAAFPFVFAFGVIVIGGLLMGSAAIHASLKDEMRANWHHVTQTGNGPGDTVGSFTKNLAAFLEGPVYTGKVEKPLRIGLETVAVLLFLWLVLALFSHLVFITTDGFGGVCEPGESAKKLESGQSIRFEPTNACFDTGLDLIKGYRYVIEFQIHDWSDAHIDADVNGWRSAAWYWYLFTPFRRHLFASWYQPIARIDNKLFDRYPLRASGDQANNRGDINRLRMEFDARRDGRLYLYLNDAVFFMPSAVKRLYENNKGYACVTVSRESQTAEDRGDETDSGAMDEVKALLNC